MQKLLALLLLALSALATDLKQINQDIHLNKQKIQKKENEKTQITNLLQKLGDQINQKNRKIQEYDAKIKQIQASIHTHQNNNLNQEKLLDQYQKILASLQQERQTIHDKIIKILINDASFIMILNHENPISPDDIMLQEIYNQLNKNSQEKIQTLAQEEGIIASKITQTMGNIAQITQSITTQRNQQKYLQTMLKEQKQLIKNLQSDLKSYNARLKQIDAERKSLDKILSNLNIRKQNTQRELAQKESQKPTKETPAESTPSTIPLEVKQVANSYKALSIAKYSGQKTIAPIDSYKVEQKFGTYFDPVYKLKVFNESVVLVSKTPNAPVKSIFDGKVVYAKEVPILKKVVIIENDNGIHTIYSQLDKIAPTIKIGLKVKKGYVIGRIEQKLNFEITQKDKHLNPLEVISKSK